MEIYARRSYGSNVASYHPRYCIPSIQKHIARNIKRVLSGVKNLVQIFSLYPVNNPLNNISTSVQILLEEIDEVKWCYDHHSTPCESNSSIFDKEMTFNDQLKLFPNPATQSISVLFPNHHNSVFYQILNPGGSVVEQGEIEANNLFQIDLTGFVDGLYVIQIISDHQVYSSKFIKN